MASNGIDAVIAEMVTEGIIEPTGAGEPDIERGLRPLFILTDKGRKGVSGPPVPDCGECWPLFDPNMDHWVQADVVDAARLRLTVGPAWPASSIAPAQLLVAGIGRPPPKESRRFYCAEILASEPSCPDLTEYAAELADAAAQFLTHSEAHEAHHWLQDNWGGCLEDVRSVRDHGVLFDPILASKSLSIRLSECAGNPMSFPAAAMFVSGR